MSNPMTDITETVVEIERLLGEATEGPWHVKDDEYRGVIYPVDAKSNPVVGGEIGSNAALIVALRNAFPAIIADWKRLKAERDAMAEALKPFLFLFTRDFEGDGEDQLEGLPDSHAFEVCWETGSKSPRITAGQVRRARKALESSQ